MLSPEGRRRSRSLAFAPRFATALCLVTVPGCLLLQPLDEVKDDGEFSAGAGGKGGSTTGGNGGSTGGKGGSTGGKGGSATGGTGGAAGTGNAAGRGGSSSGGGGKGGTGGVGGSAGTAGSGNTGNMSLVYGPVWTFDDDVEGFAIGYSEPAALGPDSTAGHDPGDGIPDDGSIAVTIPFDGPLQTVELGVALAYPLDLTGKTLAARVKLDSGFFGDTPEPGGVKLFVKTGMASVYADGAWSDLVPGEWITVVFDMNNPDYDDGIDSTDVVELGIAFKGTAADAGWTTGLFHVDTIGWVGAERPPCLLDPLLIDDMETPDGLGWTCETQGRSGTWYIFDDGSEIDETDPLKAYRSPEGTPNMLQLEALDVPRADGKSTQAVHASGRNFKSFGGAVGTTLVPGTTERATFFDASAYSGISFWARGSGSMIVQAVLADTRSAAETYPGLCEPTLGLSCNDNYSSNAFTLTNTWTKYTIPFATLHQDGWGHPVPWTYNLNALEFRWLPTETFDFWIDDVRFLDRECSDSYVDCAMDERCRRGTLVAPNCNAECSSRGYQDGECQANGCVCSTPNDDQIAFGIDAMCVCGEPTLTCSPETAALFEIQAVASTGMRDTIRCYAMYDPPSPADCDTALVSCWPN